MTATILIAIIILTIWAFRRMMAQENAKYPVPLKVDLIMQIESFKGEWGEWECDVHMSDGTTRHGIITGDQHNQIIASLEYTD